MVASGYSFPLRSTILFVILFLLLAFLTVSVRTVPPISGDLWFENLMLSVRTTALLKFFGWVTLLGNAFVVAGVTGIALLALFTSNVRRAYAYGLAVAIVGAVVTSSVMKVLVERARPDGLIPSVVETSYSFPSGHATAAMALYGFIAYILCILFPARKSLVAIIFFILIGSIGFSRLYLGVHFPSDVLAGYFIGGLWLLVGIETVKHLRRKEAAQLQRTLLKY
ncbi:MAG: PA-phosphatase-like phosphoesterase [Parcubacteria group bacterium Gr01-1014_49]|nr:MAG: PA-phosphatase-like phosphoesterase [Parcubacteria group bacterium Gr01-1014_49]